MLSRGAPSSSFGVRAGSGASRVAFSNARSLCDRVNAPFSPNKGRFPALAHKDNSTGVVDMTKHHKETWSDSDIDSAIKDNCVFAWGASEPLRKTCVHANKGEGVWYEGRGKKYLDWSAGAVCSSFGNSMPDSVLEAAITQMKTLPFVYGDLATTDVRARLCAILAEMAPGDLNGFVFASGGAEANETAVRMARRFTGRHKIMTRYRSYHGGTAGALSMTGDPRNWFVDNSTTGFIKMMDPFPFHFEWDKDQDVAVEKCLNALHDQILFEGPNSIAGIVLEPVTGANGWLVTPPAYLQGVRALCDKYGIMMISDEVMTGFGRTGKMFGFQHAPGVVPDMFTFAKGVTSAFAPFSGVGATDKVFDFFRTTPLGVGSTYSAHPVSCAIAYANLKHILDTGLVDHVNKVSPVLQAGLDELVRDHKCVKHSRCIGLGGGIDLGDGKGNFLMDMHEANQGVAVLKAAMQEEGIVTLIRGHHVHCTPPLIITEAEIKVGIEKMHRALAKLDAWLEGM